MSRTLRPTTRKLSTELLESRRLLAGEICGFEELQVAEVADTSVGAASDVELSAAETVSALDAGPTRTTAANIGSVDGTTRLSGSLGWFDRVDTIKFTIDRDAEVGVILSGLGRNADLYLTDDAGNMLGRSTRSGRSSESITVSLDGGDYFVSVVARSFRWTRYQLSISAELQPEPDAPPDPVEDAPTSGTGPLADVPYFGGTREWNLNAIDAPEAWAAGFTGQGVTVAVVDTGVDLDHPDLAHSLFVNRGEIAGNVIDDDGNGFIDDIHGYDFADRDADANDVGGHGTHVAGTIAAANNGFGATGVAPNATILPVRVLGASGSGSSLDVAAGIRYAADLGADIINLSLGGGYSRAIDSAIDYARALGSFIVAAAGNESAPSPGFPARFSATDDNVISVGAYSSSGQLARFSNDVGSSGAVQVDAPGVGIFSTFVGGRYATLSGTSMAAPHVAGLAALTLSSNPDLTSNELRDLLASGTVGRAIGSDAVGQVTAKTSVAYAAAGLSDAKAASPGGPARIGNSLAQSGRVRATAASTSVTRFDSQTTETDRNDISAWESASSALIAENVKLVASSSAAETAPEPIELDSVFENYQAEDDESDDSMGLELLA